MYYSVYNHYILNKLVGFTYNKGDKMSNYIYRRNLQGDIIGIYDSLDNEVGGYAYDSYGKCYGKYKDNSSEEEKTILNTNPFRLSWLGVSRTYICRGGNWWAHRCGYWLFCCTYNCGIVDFNWNNWWKFSSSWWGRSRWRNSY